MKLIQGANSEMASRTVLTYGVRKDSQHLHLAHTCPGGSVPGSAGVTGQIVHFQFTATFNLLPNLE